MTLACDLYCSDVNSTAEIWLWEDTKSRARMENLYRIARVLGLVALLWTVVAGVGCGGAISGSNSQTNGDPLHLGVNPGPMGSTTPQTIQVRLGSEPNDRIVSLLLTINSLQATNSGSANLDLLIDPIMVEFTRSAISTDPVVVLDIYQDTYSALVFPAMTGSVTFYDSAGQLVVQSLSIPAQTIPYNFVLGADPLVLSVSLDLAQSFTVGTSSVTVNSLAVTAQNAQPDPAVGQPEAGSITFLVGTVTNVNQVDKVISIQPASGNPMDISYDDTGGTQFVNCNPSMLADMMIETEGTTQSNGIVMATRVALIDDSLTGSELYGLLSGYAPDGMNYNLIAEGGVGVNVTTDLIGKNITVDWLAADYSVNATGLDLSTSDDLVFDETRAFPGQLVAIEWDTLVVPDPDSSNAGLMQPRMFELEQQTLSGQVAGYTYNSGSNIWTFSLNVASNASIKTMNPGLTSITVRQTPETYLRNSPTFNDGDTVKVRGLLFADPNSNSTNYQPGSPVAFIMVADRISK